MSGGAITIADNRTSYGGITIIDNTLVGNSVDGSYGTMYRNTSAELPQVSLGRYFCAGQIVMGGGGGIYIGMGLNRSSFTSDSTRAFSISSNSDVTGISSFATLYNNVATGNTAGNGLSYSYSDDISLTEGLTYNGYSCKTGTNAYKYNAVGSAIGAYNVFGRMNGHFQPILDTKNTADVSVDSLYDASSVVNGKWTVDPETNVLGMRELAQSDPLFDVVNRQNLAFGSFTYRSMMFFAYQDTS